MSNKQVMLACDERHRNDFKILASLKHMSMKDYIHEVIDDLMKSSDVGGK